ncbi:hypothetical protein Pla108_36080 [Botrimarina colliarenosi]|uniref:Uncharacterized protein n=1 Tax=Botrimarina colliarenosi TaxID=2528001 RepID=A0A5C6A5I5_9BACT|nr:hypothetical protein Pla108_36080 [Botrimarina colliarenosi]
MNLFGKRVVEIVGDDELPLAQTLPGVASGVMRRRDIALYALRFPILLKHAFIPQEIAKTTPPINTA